MLEKTERFAIITIDNTYIKFEQEEHETYPTVRTTANLNHASLNSDFDSVQEDLRILKSLEEDENSIENIYDYWIRYNTKVDRVVRVVTYTEEL